MFWWKCDDLLRKGANIMDNTRRGQLLVEKEDTERGISEARARLRKIGEVLSRFGSILMERPESIGFIRKGHSVRSTSSATTFKQTESYDVAIAGDIENVVNEVVALQDAMDRLGRIERDLISVARA